MQSSTRKHNRNCRCAQGRTRTKLQFAVLGGGTSPFLEASNAQDGVTIDLALMNSVTLIRDDKLTLEVGGGALWADVYRQLDARNLSASGTRSSLPGVAGSILGGKYLQ